VDYGERYLIDSSAGMKGTVRMLGAGFGFTANVGSSLDARLTVAWPLMDTAQTSAGSVRFYFGIGAQF
jgi:hemolysin activation/secretion protein